MKSDFCDTQSLKSSAIFITPIIFVRDTHVLHTTHLPPDSVFVIVVAVIVAVYSINEALIAWKPIPTVLVLVQL